MTLRALINSVDSEQYSESALYQRLRETKPEYGSNRRIEMTKTQLLDEILKEMSSNAFSDEEQAKFWNDFDNLQKAKIVR